MHLPQHLNHSTGKKNVTPHKFTLKRHETGMIKSKYSRIHRNQQMGPICDDRDGCGGSGCRLKFQNIIRKRQKPKVPVKLGGDGLVE